MWIYEEQFLLSSTAISFVTKICRNYYGVVLFIVALIWGAGEVRDSFLATGKKKKTHSRKEWVTCQDVSTNWCFSEVGQRLGRWAWAISHGGARRGGGSKEFTLWDTSTYFLGHHSERNGPIRAVSPTAPWPVAWACCLEASAWGSGLDGWPHAGRVRDYSQQLCEAQWAS